MIWALAYAGMTAAAFAWLRQAASYNRYANSVGEDAVLALCWPAAVVALAILTVAVTLGEASHIAGRHFDA